MEPTEIRRTGGCLCKSVRYTLLGEPLRFVLCHCLNCKKFSGSAFMDLAFYKPENFILESGQEFIKQYLDRDTASGDPVTRSFCSNCGSSVTLKKETVDWIIVCCGTIHDKFDWTPFKEVFVDHRRAFVPVICESTPDAVVSPQAPSSTEEVTSDLNMTA